MSLTNGSDSLGHNDKSKKHALVVPFLAQRSHIDGIYRLALQLARRGVTVSFVTLASDVPTRKDDKELEGLDFKFLPYNESLTLPFIRSVDDLKEFIVASFVHLQPILQDLKGKQDAPTCLVYDLFCSWGTEVSKELNIPRFPFFCSGAVFARFVQESPRLFSHEGPFVIKEDGSAELFDGTFTIPGLTPMTGPELLEQLFKQPQWPIALGHSIAEADGLIINTAYELESPQIEEIKRQYTQQAAASGRKETELFLVGPIASFKDRFPAEPESDSPRPESLQWLDSQPFQSVLYISLGSWGRWNPDQVHELAVALEAAGQRFLWVLPNTYEALPAGFEQKMRESGEGLIATGWVPQLQILKHASPMNCRYAVDVLKIGVQVGHMAWEGPSLVKSEEFERAFKFLLVDYEGKTMISSVYELMLELQDAVAEGGSSCKALDDLVQTIPGQYACISS
ncbi:hypothetical protein R1sor_027360 [Riccia sorocarpa]|uniref:UDP-glycosyltransferase n=1 Tax=Riccia sorocarpa TaxID=122646 RepID=A0ABD3GFP7_9MARC